MKKINYEIIGTDREGDSIPNWDEPIILDMRDQRIGAHYVAGAIIDYLYKRFKNPTYLDKVGELHNCRALIIIRNLDRACLDDLLNIGVMVMFGDDCGRLISENPKWKILIENCITTEA